MVGIEFLKPGRQSYLGRGGLVQGGSRVEEQVARGWSQLQAPVAHCLAAQLESLDVSQVGLRLQASLGGY